MIFGMILGGFVDYQSCSNLAIYRVSPTSIVSTSTISTSTNFQKVLHKVVLVGDLISKFVLVELTLCTTQLVQILHSTIFSKSQKSYYAGTPCIGKDSNQ